MNTQVSKLTSKYQATVPKSVREALHLAAGDRIVYDICSDNTIVIRKMESMDRDYLASLDHMLTEWASEVDDEAYKDL